MKSFIEFFSIASIRVFSATLLSQKGAEELLWVLQHYPASC